MLDVKGIPNVVLLAYQSVFYWILYIQYPSERKKEKSRKSRMSTEILHG